MILFNDHAEFEVGYTHQVCLPPRVTRRPHPTPPAVLPHPPLHLQLTTLANVPRGKKIRKPLKSRHSPSVKPICFGKSLTLGLHGALEFAILEAIISSCILRYVILEVDEPNGRLGKVFQYPPWCQGKRTIASSAGGGGRMSEPM
ncbi:5509_t:CDS:2 [Acaulospora colombiana]|uniref:5509_t:CDS:1 n=1 Tax=Acaulospora colombiana TaxID=27376 RepID=A0ACA9KJN0_9GLOM|nr:5509_t:CDS:2 [Acaulospora colombiana]